MGAAVIKELLNRTPNLDPAQIEDVILAVPSPKASRA
jgi:acetyl-CoA acetyltransferase